MKIGFAGSSMDQTTMNRPVTFDYTSNFLPDEVEQTKQELGIF